MYQFDEKVFPVAAVEFLKREPIAGNMFNNDEFGDYIIFTAWPAYRVYIDGRSDMYGEKYGGDYLKIADVQPGWKEILKKYADTKELQEACINAQLMKNNMRRVMADCIYMTYDVQGLKADGAASRTDAASEASFPT